MTGINPWPAATNIAIPKSATNYSNGFQVRLLNNIEVLHLKQGGDTFSISPDQIDDLIVALEYAKWYWKEGKYNDGT